MATPDGGGAWRPLTWIMVAGSEPRYPRSCGWRRRGRHVMSAVTEVRPRDRTRRLAGAALAGAALALAVAPLAGVARPARAGEAAPACGSGISTCAGGRTERVSVSSSGRQGNGNSGFYTPPALSADGRFVAFGSAATNLVKGDTNRTNDVFVRDRETGRTE